MKRIALLAAAMFGTGCVVSESPGGVNIYWTFQHFDWTGTFQPLTCAQAGVDTVRLDFSDGTTTTVLCSQGGVDGVNVGNFAPGSYWVNVTGYRTGVGALYTSGAVSFYVYSGSDAVANADVPGIPDNLELFPVLNGWNGSAYVPYSSPACTNAGINALTYVVKDGAGITLAQGQVSCTTNPPSIQFLNPYWIDQDTLTIRMRGWLDTTLVMDSCTTYFDHFGNDTGAYGDVVDLYYPIPSPCP